MKKLTIVRRPLLPIMINAGGMSIGPTGEFRQNTSASSKIMYKNFNVQAARRKSKRHANFHCGLDAMVYAGPSAISQKCIAGSVGLSLDQSAFAIAMVILQSLKMGKMNQSSMILASWRSIGAIQFD